MSENERTVVGSISRDLSLAVQLRDAFTGEQPRGSPHVGLADRAERFTRNPSGYYVLTDLPDDGTSVTVVVDPGEQYLPEKRDVDLSELDPLNPVEKIDLYPSPAYRFPADATQIRGMVLDSDGAPLPDANLVIEDWPVATRSDRNGEFVLYLTGLTAADVTDGTSGGTSNGTGNGNGSPGHGNGGSQGNGRPQDRENGGSQDDTSGGRTVKIAGSDPTVEATHPEVETTTATETVAVEEGSLAVVNIEF